MHEVLNVQATKSHLIHLIFKLSQDVHHKDGKNDRTPIVLTVVIEFYLSGGHTGVYQFGQRAAIFYQSAADQPSSRYEEGRLPLVVFHSRAWHCSIEPEQGSFPYRVSFFLSVLFLRLQYPHMSAMLLLDFKVYHVLYREGQKHAGNTKLKPVAGSIPVPGKDGS